VKKEKGLDRKVRFVIESLYQRDGQYELKNRMKLGVTGCSPMTKILL